ncbi:site-specific integrase [Thermanaeromonas toyohensis]|uniref:site-specific integrase n=1 Tax=Thermanaeromonas toyohensis TaxID=161154 RepID=UPI0009FE171A|nr:site-specific integrase [Thermanaeromonas toyohensis]
MGLALRWQDVDLKEGMIHVRRTLVRVTNDSGSGKTTLRYHEPKSKQSRRIVPIPEALLPALKAHKARQNEEKLLLGQAYEDSGLVFCAEDGRPLDPSSFSKRFTELAANLGLNGVTLHSLRHTYATRLLEANEHPKAVAKLNTLFVKKKIPSAPGGK